MEPARFGLATKSLTAHCQIIAAQHQVFIGE
jgi:hypothetical protein